MINLKYKFRKIIHRSIHSVIVNLRLVIYNTPIQNTFPIRNRVSSKIIFVSRFQWMSLAQNIDFNSTRIIPRTTRSTETYILNLTLSILKDDHGYLLSDSLMLHILDSKVFFKIFSKRDIRILKKNYSRSFIFLIFDQILHA